MLFFKYFLLFFISFGGTIFLVPLVNNIGLYYKVFDTPRGNNLSKIKKVRIGGLSIFLPYVIGLILALFIFDGDGNKLINLLPLLILSSFVVLFIGLVDDFINLSPWPRLIIQFLISIFVWLIGVNINALDLHFLQIDKIVYLNPYVNLFLTMFWTTGLINAINWIDGMDGLAVSLIIISSVFYFISSFLGSSEIVCILTSIIIGCCLGFFFFNRNPSKIIMGDSGSYLLGFNLAIISLVGSSIKSLNSIESIDGLVFNLPHALLLISVPIFDMTYVIISRILNNKSPFLPDKNHIHHRLNKKGFNKNQSLLIIRLILIGSSIIGTKLFLK